MGAESKPRAHTHLQVSEAAVVPHEQAADEAVTGSWPVDELGAWSGR
jgi:hypothetical protein